ncbi:hypothetical protein AB6F55_03270 [Providencia hangzhouensis]
MTEPYVLNQYQLIDILPTNDYRELIFDTPEGKVTYQALHVILATGMESFSEANIPVL